MWCTANIPQGVFTIKASEEIIKIFDENIFLNVSGSTAGSISFLVKFSHQYLIFNKLLKNLTRD